MGPPEQPAAWRGNLGRSSFANHLFGPYDRVEVTSPPRLYAMAQGYPAHGTRLLGTSLRRNAGRARAHTCVVCVTAHAKCRVGSLEGRILMCRLNRVGSIYPICRMG